MKIAKSEVQRANDTARELVCSFRYDVSDDAMAILIGLVYLAHSVSRPINRLADILDEFLAEDVEEEDIPF